MKFHLVIIVISALLDIVANLLLKKSNGFKELKVGLLAIVYAVVAFYLLAVSLSFDTQLSVAYSTWGAIGIIGTCLGGYVFYKEKLNFVGVIGVFIVIIAVMLLNS